MRKSILAIALAPIALFLAASAPVHAQETFPSRPITLIVPFPPGGSTDVAARIMADKMGAALGQPVVVENVGGAGGSIGVGRLARATPDGYTIDIWQWDTHVGSIIYNLNYDLRTDFAPIGLISVNPQLLVARKNFPADDESRVLEDALCLVFLEHQFAALAKKTTEEKLVNAVRKSWEKMTDAARNRALALPLAPAERQLIERALGG